MIASTQITDTETFAFITIRIPKVPFRFFNKLKYKIRNIVLIFVSILKLRHTT